MERTKHDAEAMLKDAGQVQTTVRARAPREHPLYVVIGVTILLIGLARDLSVAGEVAGVVATALVVVALAVTVAANLPYFRRYRQVRVRRTPHWVEWALGLWSVAAFFGLGMLLDAAIGFSFTLGAVVGAVPFLLWAQRLRRTA